MTTRRERVRTSESSPTTWTTEETKIMAKLRGTLVQSFAWAIFLLLCVALLTWFWMK
jgi:hypothetical protein